MFRFRNALAAAAVCVAGAAASVQADVVTDWNQTYLEAVRVNGGPPCPASRWCTHLYVAMFDAANSVYGDYEPIVTKIPVTQPTSARAAIAAAAHRMLIHAYPTQQALFDQAYANTMSNIPPSMARARGIKLGRQVADAVIAARQGDGSDDVTPYPQQNGPGRYVLTELDIFNSPATPNWGKVKPWAMTKGSQFRPTAPGGFKSWVRLLESQYYADQLNDVKAIGARNSATRTQDQTDIAWFWANDVDGTSKPPGQLLQITQTAAVDHGLDFYKKARLFALVSVAMGDACIAGWDAKYLTWCDLWRPITAIRQADTDNNPATDADPTWEPLAPWTPPFPAYISGHATFAGAHAAILRNYFRTDNLALDIYTDDPHYTGPLPRHYTNLTDMARENGRSRIYLGVHYQFDADPGFVVGTAVGNNAFDKIARPVCSADFDKNGFVDASDMSRFSDAFFAGDPKCDFDKNGVLDNNDLFDFLDAYNGGCN